MRVVTQVLTEEELKRDAVQITTPQLFDNGCVCHGGLFDARMGPSPHASTCLTCGGGRDTCTGHMGYISLPVGVILPMWLHIVRILTQLICPNCKHVHLPPAAVFDAANKPKDHVEILKDAGVELSKAGCAICNMPPWRIIEQSSPSDRRGITVLKRVRGKVPKRQKGLEVNNVDLNHNNNNVDDFFAPHILTGEMVRNLIEDTEASQWGNLNVAYLTKERIKSLVPRVLAVLPPNCRDVSTRDEIDNITHLYRLAMQAIRDQYSGIKLQQAVNRLYHGHMDGQRPIPGLLHHVNGGSEGGKTSHMRENLLTSHNRGVKAVIVPMVPDRMDEIDISYKMANSLAEEHSITQFTIDTIRQKVVDGLVTHIAPPPDSLSGIITPVPHGAVAQLLFTSMGQGSSSMGDEGGGGPLTGPRFTLLCDGCIEAGRIEPTVKACHGTCGVEEMTSWLKSRGVQVRLRREVGDDGDTYFISIMLLLPIPEEEEEEVTTIGYYSVLDLTQHCTKIVKVMQLEPNTWVKFPHPVFRQDTGLITVHDDETRGVKLGVDIKGWWRGFQTQPNDILSPFFDIQMPSSEIDACWKSIGAVRVGATAYTVAREGTSLLVNRVPTLDQCGIFRVTVGKLLPGDDNTIHICPDLANFSMFDFDGDTKRAVPLDEVMRAESDVLKSVTHLIETPNGTCRLKHGQHSTLGLYRLLAPVSASEAHTHEFMPLSEFYDILDVLGGSEMFDLLAHPIASSRWRCLEYVPEHLDPDTDPILVVRLHEGEGVEWNRCMNWETAANQLGVSVDALPHLLQDSPDKVKLDDTRGRLRLEIYEATDALCTRIEQLRHGSSPRVDSCHLKDASDLAEIAKAELLRGRFPRNVEICRPKRETGEEIYHSVSDLLLPLEFMREDIIYQASMRSGDPSVDYGALRFNRACLQARRHSEVEIFEKAKTNDRDYVLTGLVKAPEMNGKRVTKSADQSNTKGRVQVLWTSPDGGRKALLVKPENLKIAQEDFHDDDDDGRPGPAAGKDAYLPRAEGAAILLSVCLPTGLHAEVSDMEIKGGEIMGACPILTRKRVEGLLHEIQVHSGGGGLFASFDLLRILGQKSLSLHPVAICPSDTDVPDELERSLQKIRQDASEYIFSTTEDAYGGVETLKMDLESAEKNFQLDMILETILLDMGGNASNANERSRELHTLLFDIISTQHIHQAVDIGGSLSVDRNFVTLPYDSQIIRVKELFSSLLNTTHSKNGTRALVEAGVADLRGANFKAAFLHGGAINGITGAYPEPIRESLRGSSSGIRLEEVGVIMSPLKGGAKDPVAAFVHAVQEVKPMAGKKKKLQENGAMLRKLHLKMRDLRGGEALGSVIDGGRDRCIATLVGGDGFCGRKLYWIAYGARDVQKLQAVQDCFPQIRTRMDELIKQIKLGGGCLRLPCDPRKIAYEMVCEGGGEKEEDKDECAIIGISGGAGAGDVDFVVRTIENNLVGNVPGSRACQLGNATIAAILSTPFLSLCVHQETQTQETVTRFVDIVANIAKCAIIPRGEPIGAVTAGLIGYKWCQTTHKSQHSTANASVRHMSNSQIAKAILSNTTLNTYEVTIDFTNVDLSMDITPPSQSTAAAPSKAAKRIVDALFAAGKMSEEGRNYRYEIIDIIAARGSKADLYERLNGAPLMVEDGEESILLFVSHLDANFVKNMTGELEGVRRGYIVYSKAAPPYRRCIEGEGVGVDFDFMCIDEARLQYTPNDHTEFRVTYTKLRENEKNLAAYPQISRFDAGIWDLFPNPGDVYEAVRADGYSCLRVVV